MGCLVLSGLVEAVGSWALSHVFLLASMDCKLFLFLMKRIYGCVYFTNLNLSAMSFCSFFFPFVSTNGRSLFLHLKWWIYPSFSVHPCNRETFLSAECRFVLSLSLTTRLDPWKQPAHSLCKFETVAADETPMF